MEKVTELLNNALDGGISRLDLARRIGIPASSLFNYRYGIEPNVKNLQKLAAYFGKPLIWFLDEDSMPESSLAPDEAEVLSGYRYLKAHDDGFAQAIHTMATRHTVTNKKTAPTRKK